MFLIDYIKEVILRDSFFQGILAKDEAIKAIVIVSIIFGIGHIVNLFTGQANLETILQTTFATVWGLLSTSIVYESKGLIPCILTRGTMNAFSKFTRESVLSK